MPVKSQRKTKKNKNPSNASKKVEEIDSISKIPALENMLKNGKLTVVLVFADWCGACHRFRENIWNPMCKKSAIHNRVAVREDMVKNTSTLANSKFKYLPSVLVVDEKGNVQNFETPEGEATNAMPTPKSLEDMTRIVNVPLSEPNSRPQESEEPMYMNTSRNGESQRQSSSTNFGEDGPTPVSLKVNTEPSNKNTKVTPENWLSEAVYDNENEKKDIKKTMPYQQLGGGPGSMYKTLRLISKGMMTPSVKRILSRKNKRSSSSMTKRVRKALNVGKVVKMLRKKLTLKKR